jgi:hypothetical protein
MDECRHTLHLFSSPNKTIHIRVILQVTPRLWALVWPCILCFIHSFECEAVVKGQVSQIQNWVWKLLWGPNQFCPLFSFLCTVFILTFDFTPNLEQFMDNSILSVSILTWNWSLITMKLHWQFYEGKFTSTKAPYEVTFLTVQHTTSPTFKPSCNVMKNVGVKGPPYACTALICRVRFPIKSLGF